MIARQILVRVLVRLALDKRVPVMQGKERLCFWRGLPHRLPVARAHGACLGPLRDADEPVRVGGRHERLAVGAHALEDVLGRQELVGRLQEPSRSRSRSVTCKGSLGRCGLKGSWRFRCSIGEL